MKELQQDLIRTLSDLKHAKTLGDFSENAELACAEKERNNIYKEMEEVKNILSNIIPISKEDIVDKSFVQFNTNVLLNDKNGLEVSFQIVGDFESDPSSGQISYLSPLAKKLMLKKVGQEIEYKDKVFIIKSIS